jgi:hypothetical protein
MIRFRSAEKTMTFKQCETCLFVAMCKAANLEYCDGECYVESSTAEDEDGPILEIE